MSKEQGEAFQKVVCGMIDALEVFKKTGNRTHFIGAIDQLKTYEAEFDTTVSIKIGDTQIY